MHTLPAAARPPADRTGGGGGIGLTNDPPTPQTPAQAGLAAGEEGGRLHGPTPSPPRGSRIVSSIPLPDFFTPPAPI